MKGYEDDRQTFKTRFNGDASKITDYARTTIVVEEFHDIYFCLEELKKHINIISIDDHYEIPFPEMYRDINIVFEDPVNGHIGEIQINSKEMTKFKNENGHVLFDQIRIIKAREKLEKRNLSDDEIKQLEELSLMSKEGYNKAFEMSHKGIRIGVYGLCVRDNKILMVKTQAGSRVIYNFPGGGAESSEGLVESLQRECQEEIGCKVTVNELLCTSDKLYKHPDFEQQSFHLYYTIDFDQMIDTSIQDAEWFPLDNLPREMMLDVDKDIIKYLK